MASCQALSETLVSRAIAAGAAAALRSTAAAKDQDTMARRVWGMATLLYQNGATSLYPDEEAGRLVQTWAPARAPAGASQSARRACWAGVAWGLGMIA
ncbi:hypothetical protein D3C72_1054150 [compost metagenome]